LLDFWIQKYDAYIFAPPSVISTEYVIPFNRI